MTDFATLPPWARSQLITAVRLNQSDAAIRELQAEARKPIAQALAEDADQDIEFDQEWILVSRDTATERIEDPDDAETYVDVTRTTACYYQLPDGSTLKLPLE